MCPKNDQKVIMQFLLILFYSWAFSEKRLKNIDDSHKTSGIGKTSKIWISENQHNCTREVDFCQKQRII